MTFIDDNVNVWMYCYCLYGDEKENKIFDLIWFDLIIERSYMAIAGQMQGIRSTNFFEAISGRCKE